MIPVTLNPVRLGVGLVVLLLAACVGIQTVRLANSKTDLATEQKERAKERQSLADAARVATDQLADQKARHAAEQQENVYAFNKEKQARLAAERRATADSLRNDLRTFAAGSDLRPGIDPGACRSERDRSATLADLLAEADELAEGFAAAAEQHADEVRFLKRQIGIDRAGCRPL